MTATPDDLLATLCSAIASSIRADLPDLKACEAMAGRYSIEELRQAGSRTPAVYVSLLGTKQRAIRSGRHADHDLSIAAYVVTGQARMRDRDRDALVIAQRILRLVDDGVWGDQTGAVQRAEAPAIESLVTAAVRGMSVSLWAVRWTQPVSFDPIPEAVVASDLYVAGGIAGAPRDPHELLSPGPGDAS
ncbi:MAG: hypothetical protein ACU0BF_09080 [Paracoccaceae bacterium]